MNRSAARQGETVPRSLGEWMRLAPTLGGVSDTPLLDLQLLLASLLGVSRTQIVAHPEQMLSIDQSRDAARMVERRRNGEPLAYITGTREFWSLPIRVTPDVLIPRPETELLIETALARLGHETRQVAEIGTGSGAIAVALAKERPAWRLIANDISAAAVRVAAKNTRSLLSSGSRPLFFVGDGCLALPARRFDLVVSNPPYVAESDRAGLARTLEFEPPQALFAGDDGLDVIRRMVPEAARALVPGGLLLLEHGATQHRQVAGLLQQSGFAGVSLYRDLAGHPRVTAAEIPLRAIE